MRPPLTSDNSSNLLIGVNPTSIWIGNRCQNGNMVLSSRDKCIFFINYYRGTLVLMVKSVN